MIRGWGPNLIADTAVFLDKHNGSSKVKPMTIDELAAASQREFAALREDLASKAALKESEKTILHAIEKIDLHLSSYASRWSDDFAHLHEWVKDLDSRVKFLERAES